MLVWAKSKFSARLTLSTFRTLGERDRGVPLLFQAQLRERFAPGDQCAWEGDLCPGIGAREGDQYPGQGNSAAHCPNPPARARR